MDHHGLKSLLSVTVALNSANDFRLNVVLITFWLSITKAIFTQLLQRVKLLKGN